MALLSRTVVSLGRPFEDGELIGKSAPPDDGGASLVKRDIGNLAAVGLSQITRAVNRKLKMLQYRPEVIDGCLAGTTLVLDV